MTRNTGEKNDGHEHILLVDDDMSSRAFIAELLEEEGFIVSQTDSGEEALAMIDNENNWYALVFIDLEIPDMSGFTLVKKLKKDYMNIPFFVVSGFGDKMVIMEMLQRDCRQTLNLMTRDGGRSGWRWLK